MHVRRANLTTRAYDAQAHVVHAQSADACRIRFSPALSGVVPADELSNKGRLSPGDIAFISKYTFGTAHMSSTHRPMSKVVTPHMNTAHANISRLVGLDYINRVLGPEHYERGKTVLVDSNNPLDDWRSVEFIQEWTPDGIVMSHDSPGYILNVTGDARNDQVFNIAVQGRVQVNNGYIDEHGRGVAVHYDHQDRIAAGMHSHNKTIAGLVAGPFYEQYPLQMFDRKVRPLNELYIGLVCLKKEVKDLQGVSVLGISESASAKHIHVFKYVCFSSRQVDELVLDDFDFTAEPVYRRRGPNNPKRQRTEENSTFLGIKEEDLASMVGAWRIGKVLDVAAARMPGYSAGPVDTAYGLTLNFELGFLDWRQLRRNFGTVLFGQNLDPKNNNWGDFDHKSSRFPQDDGRVLQWPTEYSSTATDDNIPIDPTMKSEGYNYKNRYSYTKSPDEQYELYKEKLKIEPVDNSEQRDNMTENASLSLLDNVQTYTVSPISNVGEKAPTRKSADKPAATQSSVAGNTSAALSSVAVGDLASSAVAKPVVEPTPTPALKPTPKSTPKPTQMNPKPSSKSTTKAVSKADAVSTVDSTTTPTPAPVLKTSSKVPSVVGSIGDDVMASIFNSSVPTNVSTKAPGTTSLPTSRADQGGTSTDQSKSFPRRRDRS